jgi:hypothetical protein
MTSPIALSPPAAAAPPTGNQNEDLNVIGPGGVEAQVLFANQQAVAAFNLARADYNKESLSGTPSMAKPESIVWESADTAAAEAGELSATVHDFAPL